MNLNVKVARLLRKCAEKLDPLVPYNQNLSPDLIIEKCDIRRVMSKHTISRNIYEQFPDRFNQLAREDIMIGIAKALNANNLIKIMIEPDTDQVNFIGEVKVICPRE